MMILPLRILPHGAVALSKSPEIPEFPHESYVVCLYSPTADTGQEVQAPRQSVLSLTLESWLDWMMPILII